MNEDEIKALEAEARDNQSGVDANGYVIRTVNRPCGPLVG